MENQEKEELFANLNPPKVLKSFLLEDELVTLTESFFKNYQLEVYNFQTKITTWVHVLVSPPIPKEWKLKSICPDSRSSILLLGQIPIPNNPNFEDLQIYLLKKLPTNDIRQQGSNQGYSCCQILMRSTDLVMRNLMTTETINFAPNDLICFLNFFATPSQFSFDIFKAKLEEPSGGATNNAGGGGGLFGGGQPQSRQIASKVIEKYTRYTNEKSTLHSRCCSVMRGDGKLYIFGGEDADGEILSELWEFDTKTDKWTDLSPKDGVMFGRTGALMCTDGDKLYICGGKDAEGDLRDDLIVYDLDSDIWRVFKLEPFNEPIHSCFYYWGQLLIVRGRRVDVAYNNESKPYFEISGECDQENLDGTQDSTIKDYRKLFSEMLYHDVTFKVEGQEIPAHRALLSIRCPHFLQVFPAGIKDPSKKVIEVLDIKANVFKGLLEYLYCGEVPRDENVVVELLKASETYQIEELREKCQDYLMLHLRIDNTATMAKLAQNCKADKLKTAVLKFIKANESKFDVGDFNQFDKDFLIEIITYKSK